MLSQNDDHFVSATMCLYQWGTRYNYLYITLPTLRLADQGKDWLKPNLQWIMGNLQNIMDYRGSREYKHFAKSNQSPLHRTNGRQYACLKDCARRLWKSLEWAGLVDGQVSVLMYTLTFILRRDARVCTR